MLSLVAAFITAQVITFLSIPVRAYSAMVHAQPGVRPVASVAATTTLPHMSVSVPVATTTVATSTPRVARSIPTVPFYSQFTNISSPKWQKVGCGITDLTMIVDYYHPHAATVNELLKRGIAAGAYDYDAGWIYQGLINLSHSYGLNGSYYSLKGLSNQVALAKFKKSLASGPVILSVHYKFNPASTIPHLIVVNGIKGDTVYYNDPATTVGTRTISLAKFLRGWTKNVIVIRPESTLAVR